MVAQFNQNKESYQREINGFKSVQIFKLEA